MKDVFTYLKQKLSSARRARRLLGIGLIALASAVIIAHNFANIGGNVALAFNTPTVTIDAHTVHAVQSPINFRYESRGMSWFHRGVDLVAPTGTAVRPIMAGTVKEVNHYKYGYGVHVIVTHDEGYESIYGHLSKTEVKKGQKVGLETQLGKSGSTGFSTGPHLHLEIHQNGVLVNPADIVPGVK